MVLSKDAILASILTQKNISELLSEVFKEFLLPTISMRKLSEISQESDSPLQTQPHSHWCIMGIEAKVCVNREATLVHNTKNTGREMQLLLLFVSKSTPRTYIKTTHLLWTPAKIRHTRAPVPSKYNKS